MSLQSRPLFQILALVPQTAGFPLRSGLGGKAGRAIKGLTWGQKQVLCRRAGFCSINPTERLARSGVQRNEDYKRWRVYSGYERRNAHVMIK